MWELRVRRAGINVIASHVSHIIRTVQSFQVLDCRTSVPKPVEYTIAPGEGDEYQDEGTHQGYLYNTEVVFRPADLYSFRRVAILPGKVCPEERL